jgi:hypothetical protein
MATDQHAYALSVAVENTQWPTAAAATMADETATEADAQWATAAAVAVEYTHCATAATMAEETATDQPKADTQWSTVADTQATVANAQHNLRAAHYDH